MLTAVKSKGNKIMPTVTVLLDRVALLHSRASYYESCNVYNYSIDFTMDSTIFFASPNSIKVLS